MTPQQEAAIRQTLRALEALNEENSYWWQEVDKTILKDLDASEAALRQALEQQPASHVNETQKIEHEQQSADERSLFDCGTYVGSHIGREIKHNIDGPQPAAKSRNEWADSKTHFRSVFQEWLREKNGGKA